MRLTRSRVQQVAAVCANTPLFRRALEDYSFSQSPGASAPLACAPIHQKPAPTRRMYRAIAWSPPQPNNNATQIPEPPMGSR